MGGNGAEREGGLVLSDGRKGLWEDQAIPLHSGDGNQMLGERELEMQLLSQTRSCRGAGLGRTQELGGNLEGGVCKTRRRFMTSTIPPLAVVPTWVWGQGLGYRLMEAI